MISLQSVKFSVLAMALSFVLVSCDKKEIKGPQGDPGTPGGGGNATISNSAVFTIASTEWKKHDTDPVLEYKLATPLLTQNVVENGAVKVYVKRNAAWAELPNTNEDLFMQYSFVTGNLTLTFSDIHGLLPEAPETADYRIVTLSAGARMAHFSGDIKNNDNDYELSQHK